MCILPTNGSLHADKDEISHNSRYVPRTEFNCVKILSYEHNNRKGTQSKVKFSMSFLRFI